MFGKKQPVLQSVLSADTEIVGNIIFSEGLRVDGFIQGNVTTAQKDKPSLVVISEIASVDGHIEADHVIVNGRVNGNIYAHVTLEIHPKARITGDVVYNLLEMHQSAIVAGKLTPIRKDTK